MSSPETAPQYVIERATTSTEFIWGIMPPVDNGFREIAYDRLSELGLLKDIVVRGNFFETKRANDETPYSEIQIDSDALAHIAGKEPRDIINMFIDIMEQRGHTLKHSSFVRRGSHELFERR